MAETSDTDIDVAARLSTVRDQIAAAARASARAPDTITLVAISKKRSAYDG